MPFPDACFDAAVHIVTLEHVPEPGNVLKEIARVLRSGAPLLLVAPQEWQIHQAPHDYYRYTRYGIRYLLEQSGFEPQAITPAGGFFRLLSRRLMDSLRFFPAVVKPLVALLAGPPALLLPLLEPLDREKCFTLGYLCTAHKR
jgi:SAM-dependent methyltransferase